MPARSRQLWPERSARDLFGSEMRRLREDTAPFRDVTEADVMEA